MIKWYNNLYTDDIIGRKRDRIIKKIENNKLSFQVYCIAFASNKDNLFDIIDVNELLFDHYKRNTIYILGLTSSRESAFEGVRTMIDEVYKNTGAFNVREYYNFDSALQKAD